MSYSQKRYPNNELMFPTPPEWLVWYGSGNYVRPGDWPNHGQVRHMDTLSKAKKYVSTYDNRAFYSDWAIYHWDGEKYTLQYEGKQGELKADNPLFQERVPRGTAKPREMSEDELGAAIKSIMEVANG